MKHFYSSQFKGQRREIKINNKYSLRPRPGRLDLVMQSKALIITVSESLLGANLLSHDNSFEKK